MLYWLVILSTLFMQKFYLKETLNFKAFQEKAGDVATFEASTHYARVSESKVIIALRGSHL